MGKSEGGKREQEVGAGGPTGGKAVVATDHEDQVAALHFGLGEEGGEGGGTDGLAGGVEKDLAGGGVFDAGVGTLGANFAHFDGGEAGGASGVILGEGVGVSVLRLADEVEIGFQRGLLLGDWHQPGAAPEALEAIVFAGFGRENVDEEVAIVGKYPLGLLVAFDADGQLTGGLLEMEADFIGDGLDLAGIGAGADDEEIGEGSDAGEVENLDIGGFLRFGGADGGEPGRDGGGEFLGLVDLGLLQNTLLWVWYYNVGRASWPAFSATAASSARTGRPGGPPHSERRVAEGAEDGIA